MSVGFIDIESGQTVGAVFSTIDPSTGSRLLRFAINSHAPFIDMSSLYLRAHVHNKDTDAGKSLRFVALFAGFSGSDELILKHDFSSH